MKRLIDYLEEILILLGFLMFIVFGFIMSIKLGVLFISISFFSLGILTIVYKKIEGGGDESK